MRIIREEGIVQLTYLPRLFPVNCYLIEETDGLTLVDAALPMNAGFIAAAAESAGKPIARIVLTHAHDDHVGSLDALKARYPQAKVLISRRDARLLEGDSGLEDHEGNRHIRGSVPRKVKTKPDILLQDGDRIGSLTAIAVPGHTPGSMAFLDERSGILFAGDAFQTRGGVALAGVVKPLFPFPALATWSLQASVDSGRRLLGLKPKLLAVGHGELLHNPSDAMLRSVDQAERKLARKGGR